MKNNKEKSQTIYHNKIGFFKANWALLVLILLALIVVFALGYVALAPYWNKKSLENDVTTMSTTTLIFIDKIVCYSSAYGINNSETQARWDINLSQYTDIAIYLNVQTNITNMYIDNISFSNSDTGSLSLSCLSIEDFGKSPIVEEDLEEEGSEEEVEATNKIAESVEIIETADKIELSLSLPITLRYLNYNLKENCLITDIETPLTFDGSILKRGKVTLSSIKNTISFTLHVIDDSNQEYTYPVSISLEFENSETGESIYDGSYMQEISFSNAYFYCN